MKKWIKPVALAVTVAALTNTGQFFLWKNNTEQLETEYKREVATLQNTLDSIGPLIDVYSVVAKTKPGQEIKQDGLSIVRVPESMINDTYVLDPANVVGKYYKVAIAPGTPITTELTMEDEIEDSSREVDIVADTWPVGLEVGDYVDFEITYPMGETYIVLSKMRVEAINQRAIKMHLTAQQRHLYGAALVDYFVQKSRGGAITLTKYPEPGIQESAEVTYSVPANILAVITADPNVINKVDTALNMQRRAIVEADLEAVSPTESSALAGGRSTIDSTVTEAEIELNNQKIKKAEEDAWRAFEEAGQQQINIEEGVLE